MTDEQIDALIREALKDHTQFNAELWKRAIFRAALREAARIAQALYDRPVVYQGECSATANDAAFAIRAAAAAGDET